MQFNGMHSSQSQVLSLHCGFGRRHPVPTFRALVLAKFGALRGPVVDQEFARTLAELGAALCYMPLKLHQWITIF